MSGLPLSPCLPPHCEIARNPCLARLAFPPLGRRPPNACVLAYKPTDQFVPGFFGSSNLLGDLIVLLYFGILETEVLQFGLNGIESQSVSQGCV